MNVKSQILDIAMNLNRVGNWAADDYIGKKVKVWGQTFSSEQAGWLMDVGRLELLE
jgi:hypothetical protein